jgi:D-alanyl-D-alanine carboxypeptidase
MRRISIITLIVLLLGLPFPSYCIENGQQEPPSVSAQTAILIEANSGEVLYEKKSDEKAYPASITKIMTALIAIENGDLDKIVKVLMYN